MSAPRTPSFTDDEMTSIRQALSLFASVTAMQEYNVSPLDQLRRASLPESVIAWVIGDPSPAPCETCGGSGERSIIHGDGAWNIWPCPSCGGEK